MNDEIVATLVASEAKRQREGLELIPSENYTSAQGPIQIYYANIYMDHYPN